MNGHASERSTERVRVIPELRNYHVAGLGAMAPADVFYFEHKYDLDQADLPPSMRRVSVKQLRREVRRSKATTLEIWEPLWMRELAHHIGITLAWKFARPFHWRSRRVVSYAMENNDLALLLAGKRRVPAIVVRVFAFFLGAYMRAIYSRIAYASAGSRAIYETLPFVRSIESADIPNLPALPRDPIPEKDDDLVVFLARMEERKGTRHLLAAWPSVELALPNAKIVMIGDGPDEHAVAEWCAGQPRRSYRGALPHVEALKVMSRASVAVSPSVREGRWREQIGLPIHEGLLAGSTVVTTTETGLASWLHERGHRVVKPSAMPEELATAIITALREPLDPTGVRATLPIQEGRISANHWLNNFDNRTASP